MERRRTRTDSVSDGEENSDRRVSLRQRKKPIYAEDNDENDEEEEDDDEEEDGKREGDREDRQQPVPSTQNNPNGGTPNGLVIVTCGNKKGTLDVEKLGRGQECIKYEGSWINPPAFEEFGGKGSSKKWKASIFYDDKPLQFWFEQGSLTTKGFQRRAHVSKKRKKMPSDYSPESSSEESETQYEEESEEDKDEEWLPSNVELAQEKEEESVGVENVEEVVDLRSDGSQEEQDEMDTRGMEDDDTPSKAENNESVFKEREAKSIISTPKKVAMQRQVKVAIKRLSEITIDRYNKYKKHSSKDSQDEDEEERQHNSQTTGETAAAHPDASHMPDPAIIRGAEEDDEGEFSQSTKRKEDEQKKNPSETLNSSAPPSLPATSSQDIKPETEDIESPSSHSADLSFYLVLMDDGTQRETGIVSEMTDSQSGEERPEMQRCHPEVPESEDSPSFSTANIGNDSTAPTPRNAREQSTQTMCGGPPTESPSAPVECKYENMDATNSDQEAAALQVMNSEIRIPQTNEASAITPSPGMVEAPPSRPSTNCDLDSMNLDQLRREKIKMQIKVLRLQEEYYIQKMKKLET